MLPVAFVSYTNTTICFCFPLSSNAQGGTKFQRLLQYFLKAENRKGGLKEESKQIDNIPSHSLQEQKSPQHRGER